MARVKGALNTRKRHKKILKLAKGFRGAESKQFRIANQAVMRSMQNAYVGRKRRKRDFRVSERKAYRKLCSRADGSGD